MPDLSQDFFEVSFHFSPAQHALEAALIHFLKESGFSRHEIVESREKSAARLQVYLSNKKAAARLKLRFHKAHFSDAQFTIKELKSKDWADKWKEDFKIQKLGKAFVIVPAWRAKEFKPRLFRGRKPVWIDPLSAFGSGEHETTRLVVRMLEGLRNKFETFLDIGTGTAILSIVAAHLGAKSIMGFDSDKPSAECAGMNFQANGFDSTLGSFTCAELARFKTAKKYDLVCANINSRILEAHRVPIVTAAKKGGWVLVSGILRQTYDSFRDNFDGKDLRCLKVLRGRRWIAVLYRRC